MNTNNLKKFLNELFPNKTITESDIENWYQDLPKFVDFYISGEITDDDIKKLYLSNKSVFSNYEYIFQQKVARWWEYEWEETCEIIGGDLSVDDMLYHMSAEGFILK